MCQAKITRLSKSQPRRRASLDLPVLTSFAIRLQSVVFFFFFYDPATTEIYTLSLHDALPILTYVPGGVPVRESSPAESQVFPAVITLVENRKSTRLNSSHVSISYAVI